MVTAMRRSQICILIHYENQYYFLYGFPFHIIIIIILKPNSHPINNMNRNELFCRCVDDIQCLKLVFRKRINLFTMFCVWIRWDVVLITNSNPKFAEKIVCKIITAL